jgi:hypothetical protein
MKVFCGSSHSRALAFAAALAVSGAAGAQPADCDRACLRSTLDAYLDAVVAHDPAKAPLSPAFRQTENAVVVRAGSGMWQAVTALGKTQRRYLDPVTGQAAYFGTVREGSDRAIVTARVRVEQHKITEAEWYVARPGDAGMNGPPVNGRGGNVFDPDNLAANGPPERRISAAERLSRAELLAITNSYFDGISSHDGRIIRAQPGCVRLENGLEVTGREPRGPTVTGPDGHTDCRSGLETMNIQMVVARRYPLVDEEAGIVMAMGVFMRKPGTPQYRNVFSEYFVIDDGKIRTVYSAMFYAPPTLGVPNWPPYEGHWPLPASLAEQAVP